ncbi:integumentary mucin C.1-like [Frankliniella occidentalis]|uniref:Integumentary mucin C.1-like n=1 Tax=Frankliniella occidentalis TaxID=133901 RepID=A0A6J1T430_FRAOC|nr:integumentary mucin C.1-like [Frankliniella occidentalis]
MDILTTTTSQPTTLRIRTRPHFRPQSRPQESATSAQRVHPQPTARPGASHTILGPFMMALRERLPGARPVLPSAGTLEAVDTTTKPSTAAGPTQALSGEDVATIKKIEALQSGQVDLAPTNRMARLSSLQSMLVANLVALQRELAERHADLRRHMDSLHLPAEHRAEGSARTFESSTSTPATPVTVTTGPMRRKYRRPPAFRKPPAPAEDKEQAVNDNKIPYQTLFKKRTGGPTGKLRVGEATATTTTTSTTTTTTAAPTTTSPTDVMTTTVVDDHEIVTDAPATTTEANVEVTTTFAADEDRNAPTSEDPVGIGTTEALSITTSYPSSTASSTPQTELDLVGSTDSPTDIGAEGSAPAFASAPAPAPVAAALTAGSAVLQGPAEQLPGVAEGLQQGLLGFQPSPRDPVLRPSRAGRGPSRLALLGGLLPEDDPALASGLFSLDRRDRSAFRAPVQLEGGFLPMIAGSVGALQSAGAPQIVGPIPGGYRDVLRGSPVQLDLPRPDRPSDFLRRPVAPAAPTAPAAPVAPVAPAPVAPVAPRFVQRVQRVPVRTAAVTAPLRQG